MFTDKCKLASDYGTPLYVYEESILKKNFKALQEALKPINPLICYAMKANACLGILRLFSELGSGFDIVSEGELRKVIRAGGNPHKVVYSGVGKTDEEIARALHEGILFLNVESIPELEVIESIAKNLGKRAPVCFRVNPDVTAKTHKHLTTGTKTSKFGIPVDDVVAAWQRFGSSPHLEWKGLDCHIGSQITEVAPLKDAYREIVRLAQELKATGMPITHIDIGGGFGISYSGHYNPLPLGELSQAVQEVLAGTPFSFVVEPGRFLVAESGTLLTKVIYKKQSFGKNFAIVDAGMNDLVRPAMYDSFHKIEILGDVTHRPQELVDVVGPVCESGCYFAHDREMPQTVRGDILALRDAGAYGSVMASRYNMRRLPAEVLIREDGEVEVLRRRDTYEDLWSHEV
jgi:diaminopimelate decarboxylase